MRIDFSNGDYYEGDVNSNGKMHGYGRYTWADGTYYEGEFSHGYFCGYGVMQYNSGMYEGEWKNDERNGFGKMRWDVGDTYVGEWENDERTGFGKYCWASGNIYVGEFENGHLHGHGRKTYTDGAFEEGMFSYDEFCGSAGDANTDETSDNADAAETTDNADVESRFKPELNTGVTFADVAGLDDVKEQIRYKVLEPLKNPKWAKEFRIEPGAKILMYGPPGTGKTYIARAIAGEVDAVFYAVNSQDLISKYMGESAQHLKELFETALKHERAIIFFDEIDSLAGKRSDDESSSASADRNQLVATFLTLVDGFKKSKTNKMLLLIAATNRPWALDPAMLRGGRFDTHIYVGVPDKPAREFLVRKVLQGLPMDADVDLDSLAESLSGYGGGDITAICNKIKELAYMRTAQANKVKKITLADCEQVLKSYPNMIKQEDLLRFEKFRSSGANGSGEVTRRIGFY